jgi:hypothetical protein
MGLLSFGTSQNSLQASQQNNIINDQVFNFGDDNDRGTTAFGEQSLSPTQTQREEVGLSGSAGVLGGTGGPASLQRQGDSIPLSGLLPSNPKQDGSFFGRFTSTEKIIASIVTAITAILIMAVVVWKPKKSK